MPGPANRDKNVSATVEVIKTDSKLGLLNPMRVDCGRQLGLEAEGPTQESSRIGS